MPAAPGSERKVPVGECAKLSGSPLHSSSLWLVPVLFLFLSLFLSLALGPAFVDACALCSLDALFTLLIVVARKCKSIAP